MSLQQVVPSCHQADCHAPTRAGHPGCQPADGGSTKEERRSLILRLDDQENNDSCTRINIRLSASRCNVVNKHKDFEAEHIDKTDRTTDCNVKRFHKPNYQELLSHISIAQVCRMQY